MKKIITALLVPFVLFGFDISFNKKFERQIVPDRLSTNITITAVKDTESEITPELNNFNNFISKSEKVEKKAGEFAIRPKYKYTNGHSSIVGYNGILRYTIYSSNSKDMNKFIKKLLELKDDEDVSVSISGLNWIVSDAKSTDVIDELRLESILWAKQYSSSLSEELHTICKVDKISITSNSYTPMYKSARAEVMMMSNSMKDSNIPVPQANKNIISVNPHYVLECK